ncbi:hypothetical protein KKB17_00960 [bacterium]|nr:hypothetical protein [bacterium]MBU4561963.1 hypothetical protein [bacterium]
MTENIPPHPSPLPPRGEGGRREIFTPLLIKLQKRGENTKDWEKNLKKILKAATAAGEKLHPNVVAVVLLLFLLVVVSVEKFQ